MGMMTAQQAADLIAPCFEGVKAKKSLHFCNGNLRGRPISHALHCAPWVNFGTPCGVVDMQHSRSNIFRSRARKCQTAPESVTKAATGSSRSSSRATAKMGRSKRWVSPSCGFGRHPSRNIPVLRAKYFRGHALNQRAFVAGSVGAGACAFNVTDWRSTAASFLRYRRPALPPAACSEADWPWRPATRQASRRTRR